MLEKVAKALNEKNSFVLTTASPDGDSIGALAALSLALKGKKKTVEVFLSEPLPDNINFLPESKHFKLKPPNGPFDAAVIVDTGSSKLLFHGNKSKLEKLSSFVINIDHHVDNDHFGNLNLVITSAASTGEIIFQLFREMEIKITAEMAEALLTSMIADTGAFRYPNTSPETLRMAAELLERGIDHSQIIRKIYASWTVPYVKLLGIMFQKLQFDLDGQLAWSVLDDADYKAAGADADTADKMVEQLDYLKDTKVYALLRTSKGKVKVSFRSRDKYPVNEVAQSFGGGGHKLAAGCQINSSLEKAEKKVVEKLRELFQ